MEKDTKTPRKFTPLYELIHDILRKVLEYNLIILPKIRTEEMQNKNNKWYKENEFCHYHR